MKFYDELQLNAAGSKYLIKNAPSKKAKCRHMAIYIFKVLLTVAFCFVFVTAMSMAFGSENSIAGVVVLLIMLVVRHVDFDMKISDSLVAMVGVFTILIVSPRLANAVNPYMGLAINLISIMLIMILTCHDTRMQNHTTYVLCYLLLQGYDVTGDMYVTRCVALIFGLAICLAIFYGKHREKYYETTFKDLFKEYNFSSERTQWYINVTVAVSLILFVTSILNIPRGMWAGIACMSLMHPNKEDMVYRSKRRAPFNIIGGLMFLAMYYLLPESMMSMVGIIGGICIGFSASYAWQSVFNTFGAIMIVTPVFGPVKAAAMRFLMNAVGTINTWIVYHLAEVVKKVASKRNSLEA